MGEEGFPMAEQDYKAMDEPISKYRKSPKIALGTK